MSFCHQRMAKGSGKNLSCVLSTMPHSASGLVGLHMLTSTYTY